ncbi:MAG: ATP cone domain-containing protein [Archaeoglobaceae archaeon]
MKVIKKDGRRENFSEEKIIKTVTRAGLDKERAKIVAERVKEKVYDGITTDEILKIVLEEIERFSSKVSAKYNLKASLLRLGPAGYGFEKFVSSLLSEYGYKTILNTSIHGKCAMHEIDVIAERGERFIIECKFHNAPSYTGLKEILYSYARFLDIIEAGNKFDNLWIFTNTKFSSEAIKFAECRKVRLTGWRYPEGEGIEFLLENKNLYPITVLKLTSFEIEELLKNRIAFCTDIVSNEKKLRDMFGRRGGEIVEGAKSVVS